MELVEARTWPTDRAGPDPARRCAADRAPDRRGARSGARAGHHPSRSEARQHQGARRTAPSRSSTSVSRRRSDSSLEPRRRRANSPTLTARATAAGHDPRHRRLHVAGAGARQGRRPPRGHLGVRLSCSTKCSPARALRRGHRSDTIAAVLTKDPDWSKIRSDAPPALYPTHEAMPPQGSAPTSCSRWVDVRGRARGNRGRLPMPVTTGSRSNRRIWVGLCRRPHRGRCHRRRSPSPGSRRGWSAPSEPCPC